MKNPKKIVNLIFIVILVLFITLNSLPTIAVTKKTMAKDQIAKATMAVIKAEKTVKAADFNIVTAQKQLDIAIKEVSKIKKLGKEYIENYTSLSKRNIEVGKKISERKLSIKKEAEKARMAEEEKKRLIEEAENKVAAAEKLINSTNINLETDPNDLDNARNAIIAALEAVTKLDKASETYKSLMNRIDAINAVIPKESPAEKPVIYLYPTTKQDINVRISSDVSLICSYPKYKDGWNIAASPDGTLIDKETGRQYEVKTVIKDIGTGNYMNS